MGLKGSISWNIFFFKNDCIGCIDLWNDSGLQKLALKNRENLSLRWFLWVFLLSNYVFMRKRGTHCIAPKLRWAHFKGSIIPRGALWRVHNSAGRTLKAPNSAGQIYSQSLPHRILEPLKCALQNYGAFKVSPVEFWSNAMCAPLSHWDIVKGAQISTKNSLKIIYIFF